MPGATLLGKGSHAFVRRFRRGAVTPPPPSAFNVRTLFFCAIVQEAHLADAAFTPFRKLDVFAVVRPDDTQTAPNLFCNQIYFNLGGSYETTALLDPIEWATAGL